MTKIISDNDILAPAGLTPLQLNAWLARLVGKASTRIDRETWDRMRREALGEVLGTGKGGVR